ncbi:glycosyltransferase family 29 protein [Mesorhizobium tianshanense]|uniref:Glycosyl transferase family 29 (Putative sialyltransferase) n=1 Tax=Mesorhizobium tianshanense TaxID=39844 RepID=A0A562NCZ5_9HYPH|nr:glycosyltransferase family 29 protein [Mesorhizobium tianshanense]TWI30059.1 hypothetical protein IQ26_04875 [Mesorhizobium tianshanense]
MGFKSIARAATFRCRNRRLYDDELHRSRLHLVAPDFSGKSIALIGNAQSIFDRSDGQLIDDHDIVVRLNRGRVVTPKSQGNRTDVLSLANTLSMAQVREMFGNPRLIWVTPRRELMHQSMVHQADCFPISDWKRLYSLLNGRRPSAGLITLFLLRESFSPARISLFGFDWKRTNTFYHESGNRQSWHDWDAEQRLIAAWHTSDQCLGGPALENSPLLSQTDLDGP